MRFAVFYISCKSTLMFPKLSVSFFASQIFRQSVGSNSHPLPKKLVLENKSITNFLNRSSIKVQISTGDSLPLKWDHEFSE